jgi:hypothetical protein
MALEDKVCVKGWHRREVVEGKRRKHAMAILEIEDGTLPYIRRMKQGEAREE